ncbi:MAG: magnesium-translocating P-type ATPase [Synechococcaceae cyanobacterium ELA739]
MKPQQPEGLAYWAVPLESLLASLQASPKGLSSDQARERLSRHGPNTLAKATGSSAALLLVRQFSSPIILILAGAACLSFLLDSPTDGVIILLIVLISGLLGFWQEVGAASAVQQLLQTVEVCTTVLRDGVPVSLPLAEVVPGDVVVLSAGAGIPADCRLLEDRDLSLDEASLTGESFPVAKHPGLLAADAPMAQRSNVLHLGTHVVSGTGRALVVRTGRRTAYGAIADRLRQRPAETEFERGVRRFGNLLLEVTLVLIALIFAFNVYLERPVVDSFLFALALGVGLTPQLLPAIISVNLARGARRMAQRQVIVKRLAAIENFGSMDVLCADKTGTLTEGRAQISMALGADGEPSDKVLRHAYINACFETGFTNPIDEAIRRHGPGADGPGLGEGGVEGTSPEAGLNGWSKLDEVPFDFGRKRLSILVQPPGNQPPLLITKGALAKVLEVCSTAELGDGRTVPLPSVRADIEARYHALSAEGYRLLGVAVRCGQTGDDDLDGVITPQSEREMTFLGLLALSDPLKAAIADTVRELAGLGVRLKMITGDNALVAARVAQEAGLANPRVITGAELQDLSDGALPVIAQECDVFAEVEPNQKERLIRALRRGGSVVGYMGDGINDAPALHAADVSLSVQGAVDVAKEAADIVLLANDLAILAAGIREGRRTFANTLKYVFMATSANFGNMISMAGASLLLPFLPLLPKQILLTNLLTDLPEMTIAGDRVDADWIERPRRWSIPFIRRFMVTFGLVSSVFDYLTFAVLLWVLGSDVALFRTGWFVESVISAAAIVLVVRTRGPLLGSTPSRPLLLATGVVVIATLLLPSTPLGALLGFVPLPPFFLFWLLLILVAYVASAELVKGWFYRHHFEQV